MALREWFESTGGKITAGALIIVAVVVIIAAVRNVFGPPSVVAQANERIFIDAETGKPFSHEMKIGEMIPIRAPSGKESGYPAELCYWTKDGQIRQDPYAVLLEQALGRSGPTFCPDCDRLVVPHNPQPLPGDKPAPLKSEYKGRGDGEQER